MLTRPLAIVAATVAGAALLISACPAFATSWALLLKSGSAAEAQAHAAPAAPTGVSAACVSPSQRLIKVSWSAVTHATTYTVEDSTTSATGTYAPIATGQAGTSWTSASLTAGNYWFEVETYMGTKWLSVNSSATVETTTHNTGTQCIQP